MNRTRTRLNVTTPLTTKEYAYALLYGQSALFLGAAPDSVDVATLMEAWFFDDTKELHLFQEDNQWYAATTEDESGDEWQDQMFLLEHQFNANGGIQNPTITVRRYIGYDADGQAYITQTRLLALKGGT